MVKGNISVPLWLRLGVELVVLDTFDEGRPLVSGEEHGVLRGIVAVTNGNAVRANCHSNAGFGVVLGPRRNLEILVTNLKTLVHFIFLSFKKDSAVVFPSKVQI